MRRARGAAGPEKPRRDITPGLGPRRWSAEPPQVVKAGCWYRKGVLSAQTHNKSVARTRNSERKGANSAAPAHVHSSHAAHIGGSVQPGAGSLWARAGGAGAALGSEVRAKLTFRAQNWTGLLTRAKEGKHWRVRPKTPLALSCPPPRWGGLDLGSDNSGCARLGGSTFATGRFFR